MLTLLTLGLIFVGGLASVVIVPLVILRVVLGVTVSLALIPLHIVGGIVGGLTRVLFKGAFWLALLLIPLALIAFPFTILAFGAWLLYRVLRPKRQPQAYVVS